MGTPLNVIAGSVTVGVDTSPDAATPANNVYVDAGFTMEGFDLTIETEVNPIFVDQVDVPIKAVLAKTGVSFTINLAEYTLANLHQAYPGADLDGDTVKLGKPLGDTLLDMAFEFVGNGPNSTTRTITIFKANATGQVQNKFIREGVAFIPMEVACISDGTNPLFRIEDV